jgi:hypothetical protein
MYVDPDDDDDDDEEEHEEEDIGRQSRKKKKASQEKGNENQGKKQDVQAQKKGGKNNSTPVGANPVVPKPQPRLTPETCQARLLGWHTLCLTLPDCGEFAARHLLSSLGSVWPTCAAEHRLGSTGPK